MRYWGFQGLFNFPRRIWLSLVWDSFYGPGCARTAKRALALPLSISRVLVHRDMEDLLLQIVRESSNARLQNLRKSAQEAYGESI